MSIAASIVGFIVFAVFYFICYTISEYMKERFDWWDAFKDALLLSLIATSGSMIFLASLFEDMEWLVWVIIFGGSLCIAIIVAFIYHIKNRIKK